MIEADREHSVATDSQWTSDGGEAVDFRAPVHVAHNDVAAEAGIARRTFFSYFKSKDDILLSAQSGMGDAIIAALQEEPLDKGPLDATRDAIVRISARYPQKEMIILDRLMRSSEAVMARKQAGYVQHEKTLFEALCERWPELAIGAIRLSIDAWHKEGCNRPIAEHIREAFKTLKAEI